VTFVVDTQVLADHLRAEPRATAAFEGALRSGRRIAGSVLTRIELRRGAGGDEISAIEALELVVDWVAVDHEIAEIAARHAERDGGAHDPVTYVIAATAERLGADLLRPPY
jgi:predicted nucleic acid-binding protein